MGQVNIPTKGKYVHLGKSLLIQFLVNSVSALCTNKEGKQY